MGRWRSSTACERAAQWISLELDDELSEFERAALARHLESCHECREASAVIMGFTRLIREAPAAACEPSTAAPALPAVRRRRTGVRRAAFVALLAASLGSLAGVFVIPQGAPVDSSAFLSAATPIQRLEYVSAEHARIDERVVSATVPTPSPFGARVLVESI
jgi:anti-sigma factor RsiW